MTAVDGGVVRLSLNQRVQHALLAAGVITAAATGLVLARPLGAGAGPAHAWHLFSGFLSLGLVIYHLLYLAVRGYVEEERPSGWPLSLSGVDVAAAAAEARFLFGGAPARPEADEYRVSQKALYWWTLAAVTLLGATGLGVAYWVRLGTLPLLPHLAVLHRGLAHLLLASLLWHLYGALTRDGRWSPDWSWITGVLDAGVAERKVPGAWRRHLRRLEVESASGALSPERREHVRLAREREEVQAELEKGNTRALEERYVEALYHYRRALELYPGYSQARYNMARVLAKMGEREMALETYRQFLETDPFHPLAQRAREAVLELEREGGPA